MQNIPNIIFNIFGVTSRPKNEKYFNFIFQNSYFEMEVHSENYGIVIIASNDRIELIKSEDRKGLNVLVTIFCWKIFIYWSKMFNHTFRKKFQRRWTSYKQNYVSMSFSHRRKGNIPNGLRKSKKAWCDKKGWFEQKNICPFESNVGPL